MLRKNLVELVFGHRLSFDKLRRISDSLRGGKLRKLTVHADWRADFSVYPEDVKALFSEADFPCLESLYISERPDFKFPPEREEDPEEETYYTDSDLDSDY
jgi:hypothetical protein